jgi:UDP-N-acetylglucosamine 2-epimerase (non-hydrolysing)
MTLKTDKLSGPNQQKVGGAAIRLTCVVGARPNFMKVSPILKSAKSRPELHCKLVHTGQHYDERMSDLFFKELKLPKPDVYLGVGSGSHAVQTANVMSKFDDYLDHTSTDIVLVVGDVNSTLACALVAVKRDIRVAHVEAGLRSGDRTMPEEINRILTDQISDYLLTTERVAKTNLLAEGIPESRIHFVGNVMIDTLLAHREAARKSDILNHLKLEPRDYVVCTLHRPSNVDASESATNTVEAILGLSKRLPVVLPIHPRTREKFIKFGLLGNGKNWDNVRVTEPLGYLDFLALMDQSRLVFTDSGGIQEETTVLGVPCLTFRENTERPITLTEGTNHLVGTSPKAVFEAADQILSSPPRSHKLPELWDGKTAERILDILIARS